MPRFTDGVLSEISSLEVNTGLMGTYHGISIIHVYVIPLALLVPVICYALLPFLTKFIDNFISYTTSSSISLIKNLVSCLSVGFKAIKFSGLNTNSLITNCLGDKHKD